MEKPAKLNLLINAYEMIGMENFFACGFCVTVDFYGNFRYFLSTMREINRFHWKNIFIFGLDTFSQRKSTGKKEIASSEKMERKKYDLIRHQVHQILTLYVFGMMKTSILVSPRNLFSLL